MECPVRKLAKIIEYLEHSKDYRHMVFIGDDISDLRLALYTDADYAGTKDGRKSTKGCVSGLTGPAFVLSHQIYE